MVSLLNQNVALPVGLIQKHIEIIPLSLSLSVVALISLCVLLLLCVATKRYGRRDTVIRVWLRPFLVSGLSPLVFLTLFHKELGFCFASSLWVPLYW